MNYQMLGGPADGEWIALPPETVWIRVDELVQLDPDDTPESLTFLVPVRGHYLDWYAGVPK